MFNKKNVQRVQITFDLDDPIQAKAAEILNAERRKNIKRLVAEAVMVRTMARFSIADWMAMVRDFQSFDAGSEISPTDIEYPATPKFLQTGKHIGKPLTASHSDDGSELPKSAHSKSEGPDEIHIVYDEDKGGIEDNMLEAFADSMSAITGFDD